MIPRTKSFKKNLPRYLNNEQMRRNVMKATTISLKKRAQVVNELPNWEELREEAHRIKQDVINHLPEYLTVFEQHARENGITVMRAVNSREATDMAASIAREHGVQSIVKSKSMITEEIGFNDAMQSMGLEVIETDLGEYIIQLAGEPPSHLTAPAIHKSVQEIARLFQEKLGIEYSEDPHHLTTVARRVLREKFLSADMGVTGANFGIIENGNVVVVENEGNARMCLSLPRVHVAFIGMERLIHSMRELPTFLSLLSRSATGQRLTSFVSTVTGPRLANQYDSPEHVYYIIVDNGRSSFLDDEILKEALYCIRCGACYNTCPVYQNIGGHAYGWVYQGPIGAVITPQLLGLKEAAALPFASSLCGSCSDICPVKIPLHHLLLYQRKRIVEAGISSPVERAVIGGFTRVMRSRQMYVLLGKLEGNLQKLLPGSGRIPGWSKSRETPRVASKMFREWWQKKGEEQGKG